MYSQKTDLAEGNAAFRSKRYGDAIKLYRQAIDQVPELAFIIEINIKLAESRINRIDSTNKSSIQNINTSSKSCVASSKKLRHIFKPKTSWPDAIPILKSLGSKVLMGDDPVLQSFKIQCLSTLSRNRQRISVVMPTWNRAHVIKRAIDSAFTQRYPIYELIVADDGSTDGTVEMLKSEYANEIASGRLILLERQHSGLSATRNAALDKTSGDLVAYLDSDNLWHHDFTLYMASLFSSAPSLGTAYCVERINDIDEDNISLLSEEYRRDCLIAKNFIDLNTFVHKKCIVQKVGGFDTSMTRLVDWEFIIRCTKYYPSAHIPVQLVEYYLHKSTLANVTFTADWKGNFDYTIKKHVRERLKYGVDPIRVGYVIWDWPALSQTFVMNELRWLINHGVDVIVYYKTEPDMAAVLDFLILSHQVESVDQLAENILRDRRNILHSPFAYPATAQLTWPAARIAGIPFTFMPGGVDISHHANRKRNRVGEVSSDPLCVGVVTLGSYHRELLSECGVPMQKMVMARQAVSLPNFKPKQAFTQGRARIASIGRFIEKKGLVYLIRAAAELRNEILVEIYGYGPLEADLKNEVAKLGLNNVIFCGTLDNTKQLHDVYHNVDLFVLPCVEAENGDMDGLPTVVLEAMAAGVAVVTTAIANIPDLVVDGVNGFLAKPRDVASLISAIKAALSLSTNERNQLIDRANKKIRGYASDEQLMSVLIDIWRSRSIDIILVTHDTPEYDDWDTTHTIIDRIYLHTVMPFNLIVVDNNSQASFKDKLIKKYGDRPNFQLVKLSENLFVGPATNIGIRAGSSEYAVYLCSKEAFILQNGWDLQLVRSMDEVPDAAMGGFLISLPHYRTGQEYLEYPGFENWRNQYFARENQNRRFRHVQGGVLIIRRSSFDESGGFSNTVPHNGTDIEFSYYLESLGYKLLDIPEIYSISSKTSPGSSTLVNENALTMHALTLDIANRYDSIVKNRLFFCNCCEWFGDNFSLSVDGCICPKCGSSAFDRSVMRQLSLSGVLQRRPRLFVISSTDTLIRANSYLCPQSRHFNADFDPINTLSKELKSGKFDIVIVGHLQIDDVTADSIAKLIAIFVTNGGRAVIGETRTEMRDGGILSRLNKTRLKHSIASSTSNSLKLDPKLIYYIGFPLSRELKDETKVNDNNNITLGQSSCHLIN